MSKYNDHTAPLFKKLNLLTIKDILALQELNLYYKFIHNNLPPYIQQWQIKQNINIHNHYTRNQNTNLNNEDTRNESLNYELAYFHNFLKAKKLSLNVNKTKAMVFHMPQKRIQLPLIKIAGEDIAFVDNFNFLGIIINKHLNWTSHVNMLTSKLSKTIGILNTLKRVLPINIMRTVYNSLILCHLNDGVLPAKLHILQKKLFEL